MSTWSKSTQPARIAGCCAIHWSNHILINIAIYLPGDLPRVLVSGWNEPLKPFALPLRDSVVRVETQAIYDAAYRLGGIAGHIDRENGYHIEKLPFPSLLTDEQKQSAVEAITAWQMELKRLTSSK